MDRRSTIIAGIVGTVMPAQSVLIAQGTTTVPHSWRETLVTVNLIVGAVVTVLTAVLLIRRTALHAYRDWLSIRAARHAARKLELDIEVIARRTSAAAASGSPGTVIETIHPPKT